MEHGWLIGKKLGGNTIRPEQLHMQAFASDRVVLPIAFAAATARAEEERVVDWVAIQLQKHNFIEFWHNFSYLAN
jgi:hypothetical protein